MIDTEGRVINVDEQSVDASLELIEWMNTYTYFQKFLVRNDDVVYIFFSVKNERAYSCTLHQHRVHRDDQGIIVMTFTRSSIDN